MEGITSNIVEAHLIFNGSIFITRISGRGTVMFSQSCLSTGVEEVGNITCIMG